MINPLLWTYQHFEISNHLLRRCSWYWAGRIDSPCWGRSKCRSERTGFIISSSLISMSIRLPSSTTRPKMRIPLQRRLKLRIMSRQRHIRPTLAISQKSKILSGKSPKILGNWISSSPTPELHPINRRKTTLANSGARSCKSISMELSTPRKPPPESSRSRASGTSSSLLPSVLALWIFRRSKPPSVSPFSRNQEGWIHLTHLSITHPKQVWFSWRNVCPSSGWTFVGSTVSLPASLRPIC